MIDAIDAIDELIARCKPHHELKTFHEFHRQNPEVLNFLIEEIETRRSHGQKSFSFASLWHYCRWKVILDKGPASTFKMNDHLTPYYARAVVILRPAYNGWAELRHRSVNEIFGLDLEPKKRPEFYARRVVWANGTALENGWRPTQPLVVGVCEIAKRPDIHVRSL